MVRGRGADGDAMQASKCRDGRCQRAAWRMRKRHKGSREAGKRESKGWRAGVEAQWVNWETREAGRLCRRKRWGWEGCGTSRVEQCDVGKVQSGNMHVQQFLRQNLESNFLVS